MANIIGAIAKAKRLEVLMNTGCIAALVGITTICVTRGIKSIVKTIATVCY